MNFDLISDVMEAAMADLRYSETTQAWVKRKLVTDDDSMISLVELSSDKVRQPKVMESIETIDDTEYLMNYNWNEL